MFLDVPVPVIQLLHRRCQAWIENHSESDQESNPGKDAGNTEEDFNWEFEWDDVMEKITKKHFETRDAKSSRLQCGIVLQFLIFLILILGYFLGVFLYLADQGTQEVMRGDELYVAATRSLEVHECMFALQGLLTSPTVPSASNYSSTFSIRDHISELRVLNKLSVFGGYVEGKTTYTRSLPDSSDDQQTLLLERDWCDQVNEVDSAGCTAHLDEIAALGLYHAISDFNDQMDVFATSYDANIASTSFPLSTSQIQSNLNSTAFTKVYNLYQYVVNPGLDLSYSLHSSLFDGDLSALQMTIRGALVGFVVGIAFLLFLFFRPLIVQMGIDMVRTKCMLLMVPIEVIETIPALEKVFKELSQDRISKH
eukprot:GILI01008101.1.p1 GENE.GILI01008101.1~~GILI01008101.1.p1  ORF type:complete len:367 (+),score=78.35 GILI01008101.1:252-1352(+)